jgi:hypothetical protein
VKLLWRPTKFTARFAADYTHMDERSRSAAPRRR